MGWWKENGADRDDLNLFIEEIMEMCEEPKHVRCLMFKFVTNVICISSVDDESGRRPELVQFHLPTVANSK